MSGSRTLRRALILVALLPAVRTPAGSHPFLVSTSLDGHDSHPGDGICAAGPGDAEGLCTLRAAIEEANVWTGADNIQVPLGYYLFSEHSRLFINDDLTVTGAGMSSTIVDDGSAEAVGLSGMFYVSDHVAATFRQLTIRNGNGGSSGASWGGCIINFGDLVLDRVRVSECTAKLGGGIFTGGTLRVERSLITNNSLISSTQEPLGAGIYGSGDITIVASTISLNLAPLENGFGAGGGISIAGSRTTLTVIDSTISSNIAGHGSALAVDGTVAVRLFNVTLADNFGSSVIAAIAPPGGATTVSLRNTLIARNAGSACAGLTLDSEGYNLIQDSTCNVAGTGDRIGLDPKIGPLAGNGGPTGTHALLAGSPAIDGGDPAGCVDESGDALTGDQRGAGRPVDGDYDGVPRCDVGAFEAQGDPTTLTLAGGRFSLSVTWRNFEGGTGVGRAIPATEDTGFFWFFEPANLEITAKVLDACSFNARYWVFFAAASNVEFDVTVRDNESGRVKTYHNPLGVFSPSVGDTDAFPCS